MIFKMFLLKKKKASLTVEASFAAPIFLFGIMSVLSIIFYIGLLTDIQYEMFNNAYIRCLSGQKYYNIKASYDIKSIIRDNKKGLYYTEIIRRPAYLKTNPYLRLYIPMSYSEYKGISMADEDEKYVYVAKNSIVCHRSAECTYLKPHVKMVEASQIKSIRNKNGAKYKSCKRCVKNGISYYVYITDYGTKYHTDKNCNNIYHNILRVKQSDVSGMKFCKKCGGKDS